MRMFCLRKKKEKFDNVIDCPRCGISMLKKSRMGVTIDKCKKCGGIWLDKGEIENIASRIKLSDDCQPKKGKKN